MPDIRHLPDILRCAHCTATIPLDALPESGWEIQIGEPYCPRHTGLLDGIDQSDPPEPEDVTLDT